MALKKIKKGIIVCTSEYITSKDYGGLAIFLKKFLRCLKKDFKIYLIVSSDNEKIIKNNNIIIYNVNVQNFGSKILNKIFKTSFYLYQSYKINKKIEQIINENKNIKYVHFSNYQNIGFFYNKRLPSITRLSSLDGLWSSNKNYLNHYIERHTLLKSNLILSPSNFLIKKLKKNHNLKGHYLPPIIESAKIKNFKNNKIIILTFGSISPGKGSETIINIISEILKLNKNISFIWAGNVDFRYYKSNKEYEKTLKSKTIFKKRVRIIGKLKKKKLFDLINKSSIILLPSLRDNSPNACLEALSLNKLIIARNNSGYNDLIIDKYNGFLFDRDNDFQILNLIKNVLEMKKVEKKNLIKNINVRNKLFQDQVSINTYKKYLSRIN